MKMKLTKTKVTFGELGEKEDNVVQHRTGNDRTVSVPGSADTHIRIPSARDERKYPVGAEGIRKECRSVRVEYGAPARGKSLVPALVKPGRLRT